MLRKNKIFVSIGLFLLIISAFYSANVTHTANQSINTANQAYEQIRSSVTPDSISTTISTTISFATTSTTQRYIECCYPLDCPQAVNNPSHCTCTYMIQCFRETTTTSFPNIIFVKEKKKATSTPIENLPIDKENNKGRYFINRSVTFNRRFVSGQIPGQMMSVQEDDLIHYIINTNETIYNIYLFYWNGTISDITKNYSSILKH